jgi:hypothetical protein
MFEEAVLEGFVF